MNDTTDYCQHCGKLTVVCGEGTNQHFACCGGKLRSATPRFKVNDRVRVKLGIDRGHYGTIVSVGGDYRDYYGVKLDCHDKVIGYCDYELGEVATQC